MSAQGRDRAGEDPPLLHLPHLFCGRLRGGGERGSGCRGQLGEIVFDSLDGKLLDNLKLLAVRLESLGLAMARGDGISKEIQDLLETNGRE